ncbi:MAG: pantetheine-phosphate adenylyltransferase [Eubacteriales bacterium]|nr:pantetheine-phosphate adenylyltransferase [Eubacteriales bacterium]
MKTCLIPGSFDPITVGHLDIIDRATKLFDHTIISVMHNVKKKCIFTLEERMELIKKVVGERPDVEVTYFDGLMVDYARAHHVDVVVRGLRAVSDFEYEFQIGALNHQLYPELETIYLMTETKYAFLSASMVREIGYYGGNIRDLVPPQIYDEVREKLLKK